MNIVNGLFNSRFRANKNVLAVTIGSTGSGKSWLDLKLVEDWYKEKFHEPYNVKNICFGPEEAMQRLVHGKLRRGELLILEEAGTSMGSLDFQNKVSKMFNYILQSFRSTNIGIIMNLPYFTMLNKQTRMLMHFKIEMAGVNKGKGTSMFKLRHLQWNQTSGKLYTHKPKAKIDGIMRKIDKLEVEKPSKELIDAYEQRKQEFVSGLSAEVLDVMEELRANKPKLTEKQQEVVDIWEQGIFESAEVAKRLNITTSCLDNRLYGLKRRGYTLETAKLEFKRQELLKKNAKLEVLESITPAAT